MKLYKQLLLAGSAAALILLVAAALRERYASEWRPWQQAYRSRLAALAKTDADRTELVRFKIKPRQLVVLELNAVDRCVSCHVGYEDPRMKGEKQPLAPHSGDYLANHPPERFGCTVCHAGQGRAMNLREAKATDVHWDFPLLPAEYTQASCGACHAPETLADRGAPYLARGAAMFETMGCRSCHRLNGLGGALGLALDVEGTYTRPHFVMTSLVGEKTPVNWLVQHFKDAQQVIPGSTMTTRGLTDDEIRALTTYMLSLKGPQPFAGSWTAPDRYRAIADGFGLRNLDGPTLYASLCRGCHGEGTSGGYHKQLERFIPAIRGAQFTSLAREEFLRTNILKGRPTTLMAGFESGLPTRDLEVVIAHLLGDTPPAPAAAPLPAGRATPVAAAIFAQQCAGCHGGLGEGLVAPQLANPIFQQTASDALIVATVRDGRARTAMPGFQPQGRPGLTDQELSDVVAHVRALGAQGAGDGQ